MKQLTNASNQPTNPAVDIKTLHTGLTTSLQILKILCPLQKSFVDKFVPAMVRIAQRFLKLMVDGAGLPNAKNNHPQDPQAVLQYNLVQAAKTAGENLPWGNLKLSLRLASFRVLSLPQPRAVFLQMLPTILSETHVEASVRMEVLDIVKEWVEKPDSKASGNLKPPDVLALMTKLAQVDKSQFGKEMAAEWDGKLLKLLHRLCADGAHHSASLRQASLVSVDIVIFTCLPAFLHRLCLARFFRLFHVLVLKLETGFWLVGSSPFPAVSGLSLSIVKINIFRKKKLLPIV